MGGKENLYAIGHNILTIWSGPQNLGTSFVQDPIFNDI